MKISSKPFLLYVLCLSSCLSARCASEVTLAPQPERVVAELSLNDDQKLRITGKGKTHESFTEAQKEADRRKLRPGETIEYSNYRTTYSFLLVDKNGKAREVGFSYIGSHGAAYPSLRLTKAEIIGDHLLMLYDYTSYISNGPQVAFVPLRPLEPTDIGKVGFSLSRIAEAAEVSVTSARVSDDGKNPIIVLQQGGDDVLAFQCQDQGNKWKNVPIPLRRLASHDYLKNGALWRLELTVQQNARFPQNAPLPTPMPEAKPIAAPATMTAPPKVEIEARSKKTLFVLTKTPLNAKARSQTPQAVTMWGVYLDDYESKFGNGLGTVWNADIFTDVKEGKLHLAIGRSLRFWIQTLNLDARNSEFALQKEPVEGVSYDSPIMSSKRVPGLLAQSNEIYNALVDDNFFLIEAIKIRKSDDALTLELTEAAKPTKAPQLPAKPRRQTWSLSFKDYAWKQSGAAAR